MKNDFELVVVVGKCLMMMAMMAMMACKYCDGVA
jgi:hypothetical protein